MSKKKKIVIIIIILALLCLIAFFFINNSKDKDTKKNGKADVTEKSEKTKKADDKEVKEEIIVEPETKVVQPQLIVQKYTPDYYAEALNSVRKAEEVLDEESLAKAKQAVEKVNDERKQQLEERLEEVEKDIDAKKLVNTLESMVKESTSKENINDAKNYLIDEEIQDKVSNLNNESLKDELNSKLEELSKILDDETSPVVNIEDGAILTTTINLDVQDDNEVKIVLNEEEVENGVLIEDGVYTLTVTDAAFNETTITFIVDTIAPTVVEDGIEYLDGKNKQFKIVSITFAEEVKQPEGWDLSDDNMTISKEVKVKESAGSVVVEDLAGNTIEIEYAMENPDTEAPVVEEENIVYSTKEATSDPVEVTITASEPILVPEGWTIVGDFEEGDATVFKKIYEENKTEEVELEDLSGNKGKVKIVVDNITTAQDVTKPTVVENGIEYLDGKNKQFKIVSITFAEEVKQPEGWELSNANMTISKEVKVKDGAGSVTVKDLAGNETVVNYDPTN